MESVLGSDCNPARGWSKALFVGQVVVSFMAFSIAAFGQAEAGTITGTVRDASGAVFSGATVTATSQATSAIRTAHSNTLGHCCPN